MHSSARPHSTTPVQYLVVEEELVSAAYGGSGSAAIFPGVPRIDRLDASGVRRPATGILPMPKEALSWSTC